MCAVREPKTRESLSAGHVQAMIVFFLRRPIMATLYGIARSSGALRIGRVGISPELPVLDYLAALRGATPFFLARVGVTSPRWPGQPRPPSGSESAHIRFSAHDRCAELSFSITLHRSTVDGINKAEKDRCL